MSSFLHKIFQKLIIKLRSLSEKIDLGMPCKQTTWLKKMWAIRDASMVFQHDIKWIIFENMSTTTKIESMACQARGKPNTKFMLTSSHKTSQIVIGCTSSHSIRTSWIFDNQHIFSQNQILSLTTYVNSNMMMLGLMYCPCQGNQQYI